MYQSTNIQPSSTAALDRTLNIDIVRRHFGGRLRETQEFVLNHLEKSSAKRRAREKQRTMSPTDQTLMLRLEYLKLKHELGI